MNIKTAGPATEALQLLTESGLLTEFDLRFAETLAATALRWKGDSDSDLLEILKVFAVLVSHVSFSRQSACIDFAVSGIYDIFPEPEITGEGEGVKSGPGPEEKIRIRDAIAVLAGTAGNNPESLISRLDTLCKSCPTFIDHVKNIEDPVRFVPLVRYRSRLYLHRFWTYEKELADRIFAFRTTKAFGEDPADEQQIRPLCTYFADRSTENEQMQGIMTALRKPFSVISGGPGTGKTTMISVILARILQKNPDARIALCAPTGKAQARMLEAVREEVGKSLLCDQVIKERILRIPAGTVHRLLKFNYHTGHFYNNAEKLLDIDVLVVDEVSMVSLPMMVRLFRAVPPTTKIILLGDADQLASVETGAVLADICSLAHRKDSLWTQHAAFLKRSYRFEEGSGIDILKKKINAGNDEDAIQMLRETDGKTIAWDRGYHKELPGKTAELEKALAELLLVWRNGYLNAKSIAEKFLLYNQFQILCSHRGGILGVRSFNRTIRKLLNKNDAYDDGIPVMITRNNYEHRLFNGDVGICVRHGKNPVKVFFPDPEKTGEFRSFSPSVLPEHEDAFAMTIHKSQGSGFGKVLIVIPDDTESPILTRELVYTGVTRAKHKVLIWATEQALRTAVKKQTVRPSGLAERLEK